MEKQVIIITNRTYKKVPGYITKERLDKVIAKCQVLFEPKNILYFKALFYLLYYTGISKKEIENLLWSKVDIEHKRIYLPDRVVYFPEKIKLLLKQYRENSPNEIMIFDLNSPKFKMTINRINKNTSKNQIVSIDSLRNAFIVMMVRRKIPMEITMKLVGFRDPTHIYKFYVHYSKLNDDYIEKIYRKRMK